MSCCCCACPSPTRTTLVPVPVISSSSSSSSHLGVRILVLPTRSPSPALFSLSSSSCLRLRLRLRRPPQPPVVPLHAQAQSSSMAETANPDKPFSVLFVCLGNICRSPAAEAVFREAVRKRDLDLDHMFLIDSAGTIGYHQGDPADSRMRSAAKRRGVEITSMSRPIRPDDFRRFDIILAMDMQNRDDILSAYERWRFKEPLPEDAPNKVKLMCSYCKNHKETEVPDPYYGGPQGFEKVLDLLEDACEALLDSILADNSYVSAS